MTVQKLDRETEKKLIAAQRTEIAEHYIYDRLAESIKGENNRKILKDISNDELRHHNLCNYYSCQEVKPNRFKVWLYYFVSRLFGVTFGLKLMERSEQKAHAVYSELAEIIPEIKNVVSDEERHSKELFDLIDDERLEYSSDVVRGMSAALIELSGSLTGFTLVLQEKSLIFSAGLIVGITVSCSIIGTEYLATKSSTSAKIPLKSAFYAGIANVITIVFLLLPFIIFVNIYAELACMFGLAILILLILSFYLAVSRETSFIKMFIEMVAINLGIAVLAFGIGFFAREVLHVHI